jgi:archaellin
MPDRIVTAALLALVAVAGIHAGLVLAVALHLTPTRAATTPTSTATTTTRTGITTTVSPAPAAPGEYVPTPAGPPSTTQP